MKINIYLLLLIALCLGCNKVQLDVKNIHGKQIEIDQSLPIDSSFTKLILPYKKKLQGEINRILCYNPRTLSRKENELESSLGNLFADVCYQKSDSIFHIETGHHIDFALFNYGGIRTVIPKGNVTVENMFELMPFENKLVVTKLTGKKTQELFNYLERSNQAHPISNLRLKVKNDKIVDIMINNQPFDISKSYYVLTHDYLQHGGNKMFFFKDPLDLFNVQYKVRDALIESLNEIDTLSAKIDGRYVKI